MIPDQRLLASVIGFLAGVLLLIGLGAWAGYKWRDASATAELLDCQKTHLQERHDASVAARKAEAEYRVREAAARQAHQEAIDDAKSEIAAVQADADRVRVALERLRKQIAAAPRGGDAAASAPAAAGSEAAGDAQTLPADMLIRLGEAAGELAAYADQARIAGTACERAYRAVSAQ